MPLPDLVGERGHRRVLGHVQHAGADFGDRRGDASRRRLDPSGVAARQVDDVLGGETSRQPLGESEPEPLVGPRDNRDTTHSRILCPSRAPIGSQDPAYPEVTTAVMR